MIHDDDELYLQSQQPTHSEIAVSLSSCWLDIFSAFSNSLCILQFLRCLSLFIGFESANFTLYFLDAKPR